MNKISVIMPAYNCEKFIAKAINSVLTQTYSNIELIIVDDASTDHTLAICKSVNDARIQLIHNNTNQGVSYSRNKGLENASGDYIFFLDSDDYIDHTLFETIFRIDNYSLYDFIVFGKTFDYNGISREVTLPLKQGAYYVTDIVKNKINAMLDVSIGVWITNKLYKRDIVGGTRFREDLTNGEDVQFGCELIKKTKRFYVLDSYGSFYNRDNEFSLSKMGVKNILKTYVLQINCHKDIVAHCNCRLGKAFYANYMRFLSYCFQKLITCTSLNNKQKAQAIGCFTDNYDFSNEIKHAKGNFENLLKDALLTKNFESLLEDKWKV